MKYPFFSVRSVTENHQPRIEDDWIQNMAPRNDCQRENHSPIQTLDPPIHGDDRQTEYHHPRNQDKAHDYTQPEPPQDLRDLQEEVAAFDLLLRRAPRDVVREQVREDGLAQRDREPAEEEKAGRRRGTGLA